jgi:hypothetical protein
VRLVTWEKATRRISLGTPGPAWAHFLQEIVTFVGGDRLGLRPSASWGTK